LVKSPPDVIGGGRAPLREREKPGPKAFNKRKKDKQKKKTRLLRENILQVIRLGRESKTGWTPGCGLANQIS
jgi:hypothetical protein